jgi:hypothetical protein
MNKLVFICLLVLLAGIAGCDKENENVTGNPEVESYIQQLKSGEYDSYRLPEFSDADIPDLLQYRDEKQLITGFPWNPVSSFAMQECRLGIFVLWTIESIRATSIESKYLIMGFPSQNPVLALRNTEGLEMVFDDQAHEVAAKAYFKWWYSNNGKPFDSFNYIDPLETTGYRWH